MFEMQPYIVYIKPDEQNRIQAVNSSAFLTNTDGWVEIDRGFDDRFHHAQGNYFPKPKFDERGICRYLYTPDAETLWRERTQAEMDAEWEEPVPAEPIEKRVENVEGKTAELEESLDMLLSGVTSDE